MFRGHWLLFIGRLALVVFCIGLVSGVYAQDAGQRTQELAAALDKTKYKKKEKKNISIELYVEVRNEPVVKKNVSDYEGIYESEDSGYRLELRISASGAVEGGGYDTVSGDNSQKMNFTLKDARIERALLTGTKVYDNGQTEKFEAIFTNRAVASGKNKDEIASRETRFGIGFIQTTAPPAAVGSTDKNTWTNRVFLEFKK